MSGRQLFAWGWVAKGGGTRNCPLPDADPVGGERREHEPEGSTHDAGESKPRSKVGQTTERVRLEVVRLWSSPRFWENVGSACFLMALGVCLFILLALDGGVAP